MSAIMGRSLSRRRLTTKSSTSKLPSTRYYDSEGVQTTSSLGIDSEPSAEHQPHELVRQRSATLLHQGERVPSDISMFPAPRADALDEEEVAKRLADNDDKDNKALRRLLACSIEAGYSALSELQKNQEESLAFMAQKGEEASSDTNSQFRFVQDQYTLGLRTAVEVQHRQILLLLRLAFEGKEAVESRSLLQRAADAEARAAVTEAKLQQLNQALAVGSGQAEGAKQLKDELEEGELAQLRLLVEDKNKRLRRLEEDAAGKDVQLAQFQAQVLALQGAHESLVQRLLRRVAQAEELAGSSAERARRSSDDLAQLREVLEAKDKEIASLVAAADERSEQIEMLKAHGGVHRGIEAAEDVAGTALTKMKLEVAEARVQTLEGSCLQQEEQIAQLEVAIAGKDAMLSQLQAAAAEVGQKLTQELRLAAGEREALERQMLKQRNAFGDVLDGLHESLSQREDHASLQHQLRDMRQGLSLQQQIGSLQQLLRSSLQHQTAAGPPPLGQAKPATTEVLDRAWLRAAPNLQLPQLARDISRDRGTSVKRIIPSESCPDLATTAAWERGFPMSSRGGTGHDDTICY